MAKMIIKNTFGAETQTVIGSLGDSIGGAWSFTDRWVSYFGQLHRYYSDKGFNIIAHDRTINGGTAYNSAPDGYTKPVEVTGARPGRVAGFNSTALIALGCTDIIWEMGNNDIKKTPTWTEGPTTGFELMSILDAVQSECDAAGVRLHVVTLSTTIGDTSAKDLAKEINEEIIASGKYNIIDLWSIFADSNNDYFGFADDFIDAYHWSWETVGAGHNKATAFILDYFDAMFGLTQDVWELESDKYQIGDTCVTVPAGQELVIDQITEEYEIKNGAYVLKDIP